MGHLWFHTFHFPLCVTVINILLTQNTRLQWFTWTNYMYCTAQGFPYLQDTLSLLLSLCFLTVPHLPTHNIAKVFFFSSFSIQLGHKLLLIQSPYPILSKPPSPHRHPGHQAHCSPCLSSFLTLGLILSHTGTAHPYHCRPVGRESIVFMWENEWKDRMERNAEERKEKTEKEHQKMAKTKSQ